MSMGRWSEPRPEGVRYSHVGTKFGARETSGEEWWRSVCVSGLLRVSS